MKFFKQLTIEEREALADLLRHEGWRPLIKVVNRLTQDQEQAVVALTSESGPEKLFQFKLKAEGARKLANELERLQSLAREIDEKKLESE